MPVHFYIPHRKPNEKIILLLRRNPLVITMKLLFWVVAGAMPVLFYIIFGELFESLLLNEYIYPFVILFLSIYYLYVWLFVFSTFVDYYLDVWIVTNYRIINIEQQGLFSRIVSEQNLHRVQDVTSELEGFMPTVFNYGNVYVQTAGQQQRFIFKQVSSPSVIARSVAKLVENSKLQYERHMTKSGQDIS